MFLTNNNYFSPEAMMRYMSTSQYKQFEECQARAMAELEGTYKVDKQCFLEGHFFEALLENNEELFLAQHPEMVSSRGTSKGMLKSNFQRVVNAAEAFKSQPFLMDIYNRCEKQVILTGTINGIAFKACADLVDMATFDIYDTKCMRDFNKIYSEIDGRRLDWYFARGYHYQGAIYQELMRQTYGRCGNFALLAATKEEVPNVDGIVLDSELLKNALEIVEEYAPIYHAIKIGQALPTGCGTCDYCKQTKVITELRFVSEFE